MTIAEVFTVAGIISVDTISIIHYLASGIVFDLSFFSSFFRCNFYYYFVLCSTFVIFV